MKRFLIAMTVSVAAMLAAQTETYAQLDTAVTSVLGARLDEYMRIIETEPAGVKCEEADFLIGSCTDSLVRQYTAIRLYSHFTGSRLMGDETVAVHIFDTWFAPGKVRMQSDIDFMNAKIFVEFNRQSLIGMKAPELTLENLDGSNVVLFRENSLNTRLSVLFFYDSGCPSCKMESIMLRNILGEGEYPVDFYAIYTGQSRDEWEKFVDGYLQISGSGVRTTHLYDPGMKSGFQMKYGILQTPDIFLVSRDGTILGRKLDAIALKQMLDLLARPHTYGSEESSALYDNVFRQYGTSPACDEVKAVCDSMAMKTLAKKDTLIFKQMAGDLLYWLGARRGEGIKCGLSYLIDKYIHGMPGIWTGHEDSLKVTAYSDILSDLLGKAATGSRLPRIKVTGTMKSGGKERVREIRLDRLKNTTVIFHTEGCSFCEAELAAADSISAADPKARFFIADIDRILDSDPDTACMLFDTMDLSVMPYVTVLDRKGRVIRKYVSLDGQDGKS